MEFSVSRILSRKGCRNLVDSGRQLAGYMWGWSNEVIIEWYWAAIGFSVGWASKDPLSVWLHPLSTRPLTPFVWLRPLSIRLRPFSVKLCPPSAWLCLYCTWLHPLSTWLVSLPLSSEGDLAPSASWIVVVSSGNSLLIHVPIRDDGGG